MSLTTRLQFYNIRRHNVQRFQSAANLLTTRKGSNLNKKNDHRPPAAAESAAAAAAGAGAAAEATEGTASPFAFITVQTPVTSPVAGACDSRVE